VKDNRRHKIVSVSVILFIFMIPALSGCGKKGPLYLSEPSPQAVDKLVDDKEIKEKGSEQQK